MRFSSSNMLVAVAALGADESSETDRARCAGNVLDDRCRDDAGSLERLLHRARSLIPAAAGRGRRHDTQLLEVRLCSSR